MSSRRRAATGGLGALIALAAMCGCGGRSDAAGGNDGGLTDDGGGDAVSDLACAPGSAPSTIIATHAAQPLALGNAGDHLVVVVQPGTAFADQYVAVIKKDGGALTSIAEHQAGTRSLAVVGDAMFWVNEGDGTLSGATSSSDIQTLFALGAGSSRGIAADQGNVYWGFFRSGDNDSVVRSVPRSGGTPTTVGTSALAPIAADEAHLYWKTQQGLWMVQKDGGNGHLAVADPWVNDIVSDGNTVFYGREDKSHGLPVGSIMRWSPNDSGPVTLTTTAQYESAITVRDGFVYWLEWNDLDWYKTLKKVPTQGGQPVVVAERVAAGVLAIDDRCVYWAGGVAEPDTRDLDIRRSPK